MVADPDAEPADVVAARYEREKAEADPEAGPPTPPLPRVLLGQSPQWSGPAMCEARGAACPGCHGRHLDPMEACLVCHRWGMDHALAEVGIPNRPPASALEGALLASRAARIRGRTSPLARTYQGAQAAKAQVERDRLRRLREADARAREKLLAERQAEAKARATA